MGCSQESISTCRFAQRVALIKNDVSINEELDPRLMVAKLKREVAELKTQLAMGSEDGTFLAEPLSAHELESWKAKCKKFLDDKDPESILETGPDLRKILACFKFLKGFYIDVNREVSSKVSSANASASGTVTHVAVPQSAYDSKEVKDLKELLKQRDNEINILVGILKKEKAKSSLHGIANSKQNPVALQSSSAESPYKSLHNGTSHSGLRQSGLERTSSISSERTNSVTNGDLEHHKANKHFNHKTAVTSIVQHKMG